MPKILVVPVIYPGSVAIAMVRLDTTKGIHKDTVEMWDRMTQTCPLRFLFELLLQNANVTALAEKL